MKTDNEIIAAFMRIKVAPYKSHILGEVTAMVPEEGCIDYPMLNLYEPDEDWNQLMAVIRELHEFNPPEQMIDELMYALIDADIDRAFPIVLNIIKKISL